MTLTKFLSLLEKRALFFCRSDMLNDPFEGSYPRLNVKNRPNDLFKPLLSRAFKGVRKFILLNCWNISEHESAALWKLYAKDDEGIAIQTTFDRFKASFGNTGKPSVHIGKVNYIDFTKESFDERNCFFTPFLYKMKSFEYEREVRALLAIYPDNIKDNKELATASAVFEKGVFVDVDLNKLIENVYVSPTAQECFKDIIEFVLAKNGLDIIPHWTDLHKKPVY